MFAIWYGLFFTASIHPAIIVIGGSYRSESGNLSLAAGYTMHLRIYQAGHAMTFKCEARRKNRTRVEQVLGFKPTLSGTTYAFNHVHTHIRCTPAFHSCVVAPDPSSVQPPIDCDCRRSSHWHVLAQ